MWHTHPILQAAARLWSEQSAQDKNVFYFTDHLTIHEPSLCQDNNKVAFYFIIILWPSLCESLDVCVK